MRVARLLNKLPHDRFRVLHNLRYCWGDIDHVVVRQDGVLFAIETKAHRGRVGWNGWNLLLDGAPLRENWIGQAMASVRWLRKLARLFWGRGGSVRGVVVVPNGTVEFRGPAKGILVVGTARLPEVLSTWTRGHSLTSTI
jgi:hypothetical protein